MRTIGEFALGELHWVNYTNEQFFELRTSGDEVVGHLQLDADQRGDADTADQRLTFKREGFLRPHVNIRVPGSNDNVAIFHTGWKKGGTLEMDGGRQFRFSLPNLLKRQWTWTDMDGKPLVRLKKSLLASDCQVTIEPDAVTSADLPLLVVLGWYLLVVWALDGQD